MFERFTERARHVVVLAQDEARALKHRYIGTEHILLGLLREEEGVAARALVSLGLTIESVRERVLRMVGAGTDVSGDQIPFTPRAKKVLELALREALSLSHNYIGTEHILLGLIREDEGVAFSVLLEFDAGPDKVRNEVTRMLASMPSRHEAYASRAGPSLASGARPIGAATLWARIAPDIRASLGREADAGDLLVMLASIPESLVARALAVLGIDDRALDDALTQARAEAPSPFEERLELLRSQREQADAEGDEYAAAQLRAEELRARREHSEQLLHRVRTRLGLGEPPTAGAAGEGPP